MLRGLWKLAWIEVKIFAREPLGLFGTLAMPVIVFVVLGRILGGRSAGQSARFAQTLGVELQSLPAC